MESNLLPSIATMLFCVIMSAYFSATETAFSSLNKTRLKAMAENGNRRAELAYRLSEDYDRLISTILIGNNIVNIAVASIGTLLFVEVYGDIGATISTVVVTVVVLIFGEITPKSVAKDFPERFAMFSAPLIHFFIRLLAPLNFLFTQWKKLVSKMFKTNEDTKMSQEELLLLLQEVQQGGGIDADEGTLLKNAVEFCDLEAQDILTPRVDLEAVQIDTPKAKIAEVFAASQFSRLLVYDDSIDKVTGILHLKDFYTAEGITSRSVQEIITPPIFVHPTEKINDLLKHLQTEKSHIAVVIDEYGGTMGIVTMEDILEELVGEIWDEHDTVEEECSQLDEDTYLIDGDMSFEDFCDLFHLKAEADSISFGGWVMEQMGKIPDQGESFDFENLTLRVEDIHDNRIQKVRVQKHAVEEDSEEESVSA